MAESLISSTLEGFKRRYGPNYNLFVQSIAGKFMEVTCHFNNSAAIQDIEDFQKTTGFFLPIDFKEFLLLHNGASLFAHPEYGGGITLMSIAEIKELWAVYEEMLPRGWYPIGYDNEDLLLINSNKVDPKTKASSYLYWSNLIDLENNDANNLKRNFEIWLDRLFIAQGYKYWEWNIYTAETFYKTHEY